jgi:hypothetical protein
VGRKPGTLRKVILLLLAITGCVQRYDILRNTSYPNPPTERLKLLVMPMNPIREFRNTISVEFLEALQDNFQRELEREYVQVEVEGPYTPDMRTTKSARLDREKNPFIAIDRSEALEKIRSSKIDLRKKLSPEEFKSIGKACGTDFLLFGLAKRTWIMALNSPNPDFFNATRTVPVIQLYVLLMETSTGTVIFETKVQVVDRPEGDETSTADPIARLTRDVLGKMLWTSFP